MSNSTESFVKPVLPSNDKFSALTPEQILEISKLVRENTAEAINTAKFDSEAATQVLRKKTLPIIDYSKLTQEDIYDLDIPIEAKAFMSADSLKVELADSNYEARWVNLNPQNLGNMISRGFTYVEPGDLAETTANEAIQTSLDAEGKYSIHDVVAMKIDKATYYKALRAAHLRSKEVLNQALYRKTAISTANDSMSSEAGSDGSAELRSKRVEFYDPGIGV